MICVTGDNGVKHWCVAFTRSSVSFQVIEGKSWQMTVVPDPRKWRLKSATRVEHADNRFIGLKYIGPFVIVQRRPLLAAA